MLESANGLDTESATGVIEDGADSVFVHSRRNVGVCVHALNPRILRSLSPIFASLMKVAGDQRRICSCRALVVSKNLYRSRRRSCAYLSVPLSFSPWAMQSLRKPIVGSNSRFLRSSITRRNISQTSFILSKWSRLSCFTWTSFTKPQPCSSFRLLLTFE